MAFDWRNFRYTYDESVGYKYPDFQSMGEIIEYFSERGLVTTMGCTSPACPPTTDEIAEQYCIAIAELNHRNGDTSGSISSGGGKCGGSCGFHDKADSTSESESKPSTPDSEESSDPAAEEAAEAQENTLDEMDEVEIPADEGELEDLEANQVLSENPNNSVFEDMVNRFQSYDPEKIIQNTMATLDVLKSRREAHREALEGKRQSMDSTHSKECLSYNKEYTTTCQMHKDDIFVSAVTKKMIEELTPDKVYDAEAPIQSEDTEAPSEEVQQEAETSEQDSPSDEAPINLMKGNCGGKKAAAKQNQNNKSVPTTEDKNPEDAEVKDSVLKNASNWLLDTTDEALDDFVDRALGQDIKDMSLQAVKGDLTGDQMEHLMGRILDALEGGFTKDTLKGLERSTIDATLGTILGKLGFASTDRINLANRAELTNAVVSRALSFCAEKGYLDTFYGLVEKMSPASQLVNQYLPMLMQNGTPTIDKGKIVSWLANYAGVEFQNEVDGVVVDLTKSLVTGKTSLQKSVHTTVATVNGWITQQQGPETSAFTTALCNMAKPLVAIGGATLNNKIEQGTGELISRAYQASYIPQYYHK